MIEIAEIVQALRDGKSLADIAVNMPQTMDSIFALNEAARQMGLEPFFDQPDG